MHSLQKSRIVTLAGICHRSEQAFGQAIHSTSCKEFRGCVGKVRQVLHEFRFELLSEIERVGGGAAASLLKESEYAAAYSTGGSSLQYLVDNYRRVLEKPLPPHAAAMIRRQHRQLQELLKEFTEFITLLQGLIDDRHRGAATAGSGR
jgi:hypothetical protein